MISVIRQTVCAIPQAVFANSLCCRGFGGVSSVLGIRSPPIFAPSAHDLLCAGAVTVMVGLPVRPYARSSTIGTHSRQGLPTCRTYLAKAGCSVLRGARQAAPSNSLSVYTLWQEFGNLPLLPRYAYLVLSASVRHSVSSAYRIVSYFSSWVSYRIMSDGS